MRIMQCDGTNWSFVFTYLPLFLDMPPGIQQLQMRTKTDIAKFSYHKCEYEQMTDITNAVLFIQISGLFVCELK